MDPRVTDKYREQLDLNESPSEKEGKWGWS